MLLLLAIGFWTISAMSGRRQKISAQAIEGGLEALILNILILLLVVTWDSSLNDQVKYILGNLIRFHIIQLLYVILRSLFLRRQQRWAKLKGLIAASILIVLGVDLFNWLIMSLPLID
ncbi:MAG: hypothetical protein LH702_33595 [Phormidesmis sp. CAN_BIN44]|nr:hypothetical protein [Phormidesmis sp. CAN_BIN44]